MSFTCFMFSNAEHHFGVSRLTRFVTDFFECIRQKCKNKKTARTADDCTNNSYIKASVVRAAEYPGN